MNANVIPTLERAVAAWRAEVRYVRAYAQQSAWDALAHAAAIRENLLSEHLFEETRSESVWQYAVLLQGSRERARRYRARVREANVELSRARARLAIARGELTTCPECGKAIAGHVHRAGGEPCA